MHNPISQVTCTVLDSVFLNCISEACFWDVKKRPLRYFKYFIIYYSDTPPNGTFRSDGNVLYLCCPVCVAAYYMRLLSA